MNERKEGRKWQAENPCFVFDWQDMNIGKKTTTNQIKKKEIKCSRQSRKVKKVKKRKDIRMKE